MVAPRCPAWIHRVDEKRLRAAIVDHFELMQGRNGQAFHPARRVDRRPHRRLQPSASPGQQPLTRIRHDGTSARLAPDARFRGRPPALCHVAGEYAAYADECAQQRGSGRTREAFAGRRRTVAPSIASRSVATGCVSASTISWQHTCRIALMADGACRGNGGPCRSRMLLFGRRRT